MNALCPNTLFIDTLGLRHFDCPHAQCKWLKEGMCCRCRMDLISGYLEEDKTAAWIYGKLGNAFACKEKSVKKLGPRKMLRDMEDSPEIDGLYFLTNCKTNNVILSRFLIGEWSTMGKFGRWEKMDKEVKDVCNWIQE